MLREPRRSVNDVYSKQVCDLFTKGSHHRNISVILITQNLFHQGRYCRDISLNAKYLVPLKYVRDKNQFIHLARQVYPENSNSLYKSYLDATQRPHGYFILDLSQDTNDFLRFRNNIFPAEHLPSSTRRLRMKQVNFNYPALHVLTTAQFKLRKAIVSNCDRDLFNSICECVLNVLNGNVKLSGCDTRKLRKHKAVLRQVADKRVPLSGKKFIVQRGG